MRVEEKNNPPEPCLSSMQCLLATQGILSALMLAFAFESDSQDLACERLRLILGVKWLLVHRHYRWDLRSDCSVLVYASSLWGWR